MMKKTSKAAVVLRQKRELGGVGGVVGREAVMKP